MALFALFGVLRGFSVAAYSTYASPQTLVRPWSGQKLLISALDTPIIYFKVVDMRSQAEFCGAKLNLIHSSHNWWRRIRYRKIQQKKMRFDPHRLCWQSRRQTLADRNFFRCRPDNNLVPLFQKRVVQNLFRKFHNDIHKSAFIRSWSDSPFLLKRRCFLLRKE